MDAFDILDDYEDTVDDRDYNHEEFEREQLRQILDEYNEDFDFEQLYSNLNEEEMASIKVCMKNVFEVGLI